MFRKIPSTILVCIFLWCCHTNSGYSAYYNNHVVTPILRYLNSEEEKCGYVQVIKCQSWSWFWLSHLSRHDRLQYWCLKYLLYSYITQLYIKWNASVTYGQRLGYDQDTFGSSCTGVYTPCSGSMWRNLVEVAAEVEKSTPSKQKV